MTERTEQGFADPEGDATPAEPVGDALMRAELKSRMFGVAAPVAIGRFDVLNKLGEGGMGVVYAARDRELDRRIALKLLHGSASDSRQLSREAKALAQLSHPNVVAIHDVGEVGDRMYIAMEFVQGVTLRAFVGEAPPWRQIVAAYVQAGEGLLAAHAVGIVHRDFKPDNAIRGEDGRVRVLDFGLARASGVVEPAVDAALPTLPEGLTATGHIRGTPAYMAPEQAMGLPVDARSDQYSWCVALYEALAGFRPFAGDTHLAVARAAALGAIEPPRPDSEVPTGVWTALRRGLAAEPDDRFASLRELLDALTDAERRPRPATGWARIAKSPWVYVAVAGLTTLGYAVAQDSPAPIAAGAASMADATSDNARLDSPDAVPSNERGSSDGAPGDPGSIAPGDGQGEPLLPPPECPPFRDPGLDPEVRSKRMTYLATLVTPMADDDARLPESLLWVSELSLQAGDRSAACAALERLSRLSLSGDVADAAPCWRRTLCTPAKVDCPEGFRVDVTKGCKPVARCEIDVGDDDALTAVADACERDDAVCCPMAFKLAQVAQRRAGRAGDEDALARAEAQVIERGRLACEQGYAALCAYTAELLLEAEPAGAETAKQVSEQAAQLSARACRLGHVASCD